MIFQRCFKIMFVKNFCTGAGPLFPRLVVSRPIANMMGSPTYVGFIIWTPCGYRRY